MKAMRSKLPDVVAFAQLGYARPDGARRYTAEMLDEAALEDLWAHRVAITGLMTSLKAMQGEVDARIADELGEGGCVVFDGQLIRYKQGGSWKAVDPDILWDFLADDARHCFRPDDIRITGLRAIAAQRAEAELRTLDQEEVAHITEDDVKRRTRVIVDSLMDYERGEARVEVMPATSPRAPKYAARLRPGEVRPGKSRTTTVHPDAQARI